MKKTTLFLMILMAVFFSGCEDVVQVDLDTAPPKLVIEAAIIWQKGSSGTTQKIKLSTTTDYFNNAVPRVSGATVSVKNSSDTVFNFIETPDTGEYICENFIPVLNETYTLTVINDGNIYEATETLKAVAPITKIIQNNEGGFTGNNIEIKTFYDDPIPEENYYLYQYIYSNQIKFDYYVDEDIFFQGNEFFSLSQKDDLKAGDKVMVTHYGISKAYYNYMSILVSIAGNNGGGPFQSPPATVRGNIVNTTNPKNYPLGYFSLSESDSINYTVE